MFLLAGLIVIPAQVSSPVAAVGAGTVNPVPVATDYAIIEQGPHSRVWARVELLTNSLGFVSAHTNRYVELQTGLAYLNNGQYVDSQEIIEGFPGGAIARQGQIQIIFPNDLYGEPIDAQTAAGRFRSAVVCLSYADYSLQTNVMIAEIQPCQGQIIPPTQVLYPRAFTNDVNASVRYTYRKSGWEQDIIIDDPGSLPTPEALGLDSASPTLVLQVITEFLEAPPPQTSDMVMAADGVTLRDQTVDWGMMRLGEGQALFLGQATNSNPVATAKHWVVTPDNRQFLIEEVPFARVLSNILSQSGGASLDTQARKVQTIASLDCLRKLKPSTPGAKRMELATARPPDRGLVIDYVTVSSSATNYRFQGDTTYYVSGLVSLSGTTICEGGTVIKFTNYPTAKISMSGPLQCNGNRYQPIVMTSKDDNSVGGSINGSTGSPTNYNGATYLQDNNNQNNTYRFLRLLHAGTGLSAANFSNGVWHCQFVKCGTAINATSNGPVVLRNVLIAQSTNAVVTAGTLQAEHLTVDQCTTLLSGAGSSGCVTNSLITAVSAVTNVTCWYSPRFTTGNGVYQGVGAAAYYLANGSTNRNAGLTNINPTLASNLWLRTTYPPIVCSSVTFSVNTTFLPQAQRDTDLPDLGYHYDPIDYICSCCVSNATLTLTNGVVVAYFDNIGLWLHNGSGLLSGGSPVQRNYLVHYNLVQEQPVYLAATNSLSTAVPINTWHTDSSRNPSLTLRFTALVAPVGANYVVFTGAGGWEIGAFTMQDCELYGAGTSWYQYADVVGSAITLRNNLFQYAYIDVETYGQATTYNNLFTGTTNYSTWIANLGTGAFTNTDNAFDRGWVYLDGSVSNNAYLNGVTLQSTLQPGDLVTNLAWVTGPLGNYYQSTNSPLINHGSRTADLAGLYHYTTETNQLQETNSVVDIGYHYVAFDSNGNPLDTDGDGIPDYLEDTNGNGVYDAGDLSDWKHYNSPNGLINGSGLQVFTPLK
jgi:hypothetical protein